MYRENLDPSNEIIEGVITSFIYGVRSVAAQSEAGIQKLCNLIEDTKQNVVFLLRRRRYVDDMAKSLRTKVEREKLMKDTD